MNYVAEQYAALREGTGYYPVAASLVKLTGLERGELLRLVLARDSQYAEPGSARESLILDDTAAVWDVVTHIEQDETSWLISQSRTDLPGLLASIAERGGLAEVEIIDAAPGWIAIAFEGPRAWELAAQLVDSDVSSLVLHGATGVTLPGTDAGGVLARIGSTGEYGYLLLAPAEFGAGAWARAQSAREVGAQALRRARTEVRHPQIPAQSHGLTVREADLEWLVDWNREDEFLGSRALKGLPPPARGLIAVSADRNLAQGARVEAGGRPIGTIQLIAPLDGADHQLALALVDKPFDVPGLTLASLDEAGRETAALTLASPTVSPRSWTGELGGGR
jgi:glycine cleavage system aminomethyltransferase T